MGIKGYAVLLNQELSTSNCLISSTEVDDFLEIEEVEDNFYKDYMQYSTSIVNNKKKKAASYDQMLEVVRRKWKENYSMLSILYDMYAHLSYNLFS